MRVAEKKAKDMSNAEIMYVVKTKMKDPAFLKSIEPIIKKRRKRRPTVSEKPKRRRRNGKYTDKIRNNPVIYPASPIECETPGPWDVALLVNYTIGTSVSRTSVIIDSNPIMKVRELNVTKRVRKRNNWIFFASIGPFNNYNEADLTRKRLIKDCRGLQKRWERLCKLANEKKMVLKITQTHFEEFKVRFTKQRANEKTQFKRQLEQEFYSYYKSCRDWPRTKEMMLKQLHTKRPDPSKLGKYAPLVSENSTAIIHSCKEY